MKTFDDYMKLPYRMELVPDPHEGGFVASYPELPGCVSCGETIESAVANAADAKAVWLQAAMDNGIAIPAPTDPSALEKTAGHGADPVTYTQGSDENAGQHAPQNKK